MTAATAPVETEAEARAGVRDIYEAAHNSPRRGVMAEESHRLLCGVLDAAGVQLGAYDHRITAWLADWEPHVVSVIAGWIARANGGAR